ncbi:dsDNA-binding protein PDCD5 [Tirmania nivea]|nr:dsDNA-binding protein PDCD5 [Tirmania nivea]
MSDDADLQRIRAARLQQLAAQGSAAAGNGNGGGGGSGGDDDPQRSTESAARKSLLAQILTPEAADRLGRIALVNADRARDAEDRMIVMARAGQLRQRATEDDLLRLLGALREREKEAHERGVGRVVFSRRKGGWDEQDEEEF